MKVLVVGAAGNLGRRLVARGLAHGHAVTAFVRDASRFAAASPDAAEPGVTVVEGDAFDPAALSSGVSGQEVVINAAGNVADGERFSELFAAILATVERSPPSTGRFWALAGAAVLTLPHFGGIGVGLPGVPTMYIPHERNWRRLEASALDWSLMCPGPMVAAPGEGLRSDLRVSIDVVPYPVPTWAGWAPRLALSLLMKSKLPELIVSYEDVAELIMSNLAPAGRLSRHRVGMALPAGEHASKTGWTLGKRGADA